MNRNVNAQVHNQQNGQTGAVGQPPPPPNAAPPVGTMGPSFFPQQQQQQQGAGWGGQPSVSLQQHHWQPAGPVFYPGPGGMGGHYAMPAMQQQQPMMVMQPAHFGMGHMGYGGAGGMMMNPIWQAQQQQQQQRQFQQQHNINLMQQDRAMQAAAAPGDGRPTLALPPAKRQRKKDVVPPLEKVTEEPTVRKPASEAERQEVAAWQAERKRNWPSAANLEKKEREMATRRERGELDPDDSRQARLRDILHRQRDMGLSKKAGTEDLLMQMSRGSGGRGGRDWGRGGRGGGQRGRGRGGRFGSGGGGRGGSLGRGQFGGHSSGVQAFLEAGNAPQVDPGLEKWRQRQGKPHEEGAAIVEPPATATATATAVPKEDSETAMPEGIGALLGYGSDAEEGKHQGSAALVAQGATEPAPAVITAAAAKEPAGAKSAESDRGRGRGDRGRRGRGTGEQRGRGGGRGQQQQRQPYHAPPRPQEASLLEKLLAADIRQDMSYLLQAFRFFVKNDFFEGYASGSSQLRFPAGSTAAPPPPSQPTSVQEILARREGVDVPDSDEELLEEREELRVAEEESSSSSGSEESSGEEEEEGGTDFLPHSHHT